MWTSDATMPPTRYSTRNQNGPSWSSTLLPKIQKNNMFPSTCRIDACRNIEKNTASHTFLCGKAGCGAEMPAAWIAHDVGAASPVGDDDDGLARVHLAGHPGPAVLEQCLGVPAVLWGTGSRSRSRC